MELHNLGEEDDSQERGYAIQHGAQIMSHPDVDGYDDLNTASTCLEEAMACKTPDLKWKCAAKDDGDIILDLEPNTKMEETEDVAMGPPCVTAQISLMVIETTLMKTIKARGVAHSKSRSVSAGSSVGGEITVSHSDTTLSTKLKGKVTKPDLPPLLQDDCDHKFAKNVLPSLLLWYGDETNVWSISEEDLTHTLKAIIWVVYPTFDKFDEIHHRMAIYGLAIQWLTHWWHNFASTAVVLVVDFFKENPDLSAETFCDILLEDQGFAYEDLDTHDSVKAFHSTLILELLSTAHLQQVDGWVDVLVLGLMEKHAYGIRGALVMSTAALECAIKVVCEYTLNGEQMVTDQLASIHKKGKAGVKTPCFLSKVLGKESLATSQFSQLNCGKKTASYLTSIRN
ncbi:hypothetical protein EDC04DRAFT_2904768 [Pisolithus marmoratus]|nr:hypothetical protein EDC04DRAFT_2904768 [Pisolithus marmoratus]